MYIDFGKFNYDLLEEKKREEYILRDKNAYKEVLRRWFEKNLDDIVERKWDIKEIKYIKDVGDFVKLLKEAETLYELGFFTSCIALVGVASEDFTSFLFNKLGYSRGNFKNQFDALRFLKDKGALSVELFKNMDAIRVIRNDCLHFNNNFKMKEDPDLRKEAISALNNFKDIVQILIGINQGAITLENLDKLSESLSNDIGSSTSYVKDFDDMVLKIRNATSHLFNIDLTFDPKKKYVERESLYYVDEIDPKEGEFGEITLIDLSSPGLVFVDLDANSIEMLKEHEINRNDHIYAKIKSEIDMNGMSAEWRFVDLRKM